MKKVIALLFLLVVGFSLSSCNYDKLKKENDTLKAKIEQLKQENAKLKETADYHYQQGLLNIENKKFDKAKSDFEILIKNYPKSNLLGSAKQKLKEIKVKLQKIEQQKKIEAQKKANGQRQPYIEKLKELDEEIRNQALWDIGRGRRTSVQSMIYKKFGQATQEVEAAYGFQFGYIYGNIYNLDKVKLSDVKETAPFVIFIPRNLTCPEYTTYLLECYSYGKSLIRQNSEGLYKVINS